MSGRSEVSCNKILNWLLNVLISYFLTPWPWSLFFFFWEHTCTAVQNRTLKGIQNTSEHLLRERFMLLHYIVLLFHAEAFYQWLSFFWCELLFPEMVSPSWQWSAAAAFNIWSCYFSSKWENTLPTPTACSLDKAQKKVRRKRQKKRDT